MPFVTLGYGLDDDAWLMARAADLIASGDGYAASRFPGYPTVELLLGLLFRLLDPSCLVGNLAAAAAGLAATVGVWVCLRGVVTTPLRLLSAIAVALHPAMWTASVTTLDPIFGAALLVLAVAAAGRGRPALGGLLLGLAVGCRLTNALAVLPLALFLRGRHGSWAPAARLVVVGAVVGGALFLLPLLTYGWGFLQYEPVRHRDFVTGGYKVYRELLGPALVLGCAVVAAAVLASGPRRQRLRAAAGEPLVLLGAAALLVLSAPFLLLPTDPQYLLPWVPFAVLALAGLVRCEVVRPWWAAGLLLAAVLPAAVGLGELDLDAWRSRRELRPVWLATGRAAENLRERSAQLVRAREAAAFPYPPHSAVVLGRPFMAAQSALGVAERDLATYVVEHPARDVLLFRLVPPSLRDRLEGRAVFYAEGEHLEYLSRRIFGYGLDELGARPLQLWPAAAAEGAAP
ncbi:MAG: hypothetical protein MUE90_13060 [Thermoanaerobaculales bacterium]|jgi:hypothetical protein|nr:hypothetical protein [Thermoanaerobaculales bacterium]